MKEALINKIEELKSKQYHQIGDVYAVLQELENYIKKYED